MSQFDAYEDLPPIATRFLRYVQVDTQSDPESPTVPSTVKQLDLSRMLGAELDSMGAPQTEVTAAGYVFATIPARTPPAVDPATLPIVGLLAHVDTSPDAPGSGVRPVVHRSYDGRPIVLPGNADIVLDPADQPMLLQHVGQDLITSDGTTLLGSDDKAGVAILMQLVEDLLEDAAALRPKIRICFTVDEEIGRGVDFLDLAEFGADIGYTLDGTGVDTICAETFNAVEALVRISGVNVHPGYARGKLVNALRLAADFVAALPMELSPEQTEGRRGFIHPVRIAESDCAAAEIKMILRDFDMDAIDRQKSILEDIGSRIGAENESARIEVTFREQYRNMRSYIEALDPRVLSFAVAAAAEIGIELREEIVRGGTDGARLSEMGVPTPNLFDGGYDYHSLFEWNTVQNLERSLDYLKQLLRYWAINGASGQV